MYKYYEFSALNSDEPSPVIYNALNLMKEFGDRERLSGFCFAWRDWHPLSQSNGTKLTTDASRNRMGFEAQSPEKC